ncbi:50S ribosomal protein L2 [Candidatus Woesearchaeota archaeon]|nr:50S ribosomal protein L2 [Candidatus Woesearchaeota archaeon]
MGKNIIQQARGKGGPTYRAPSFRYKAEVKYLKNVVAGKIGDIVKCQGHSAPLIKLKYNNGKENYLIAAEGIRVEDTISIGPTAELKQGNILPLKNIPVGTQIFNIESIPGDGGKFVRSSGGFARIISKKKEDIVVQLPSKKYKSFNPNCMACIGIIAGSGRKDKPFLKAGKRYYYMKSRNKLYPLTSGQAMNAVDHPYGTTRSSKKGFPTIAPKNAPPGRKVGKIRPRKTGKKR